MKLAHDEELVTVVRALCAQHDVSSEDTRRRTRPVAREALRGELGSEPDLGDQEDCRAQRRGEGKGGVACRRQGFSRCVCRWECVCVGLRRSPVQAEAMAGGTGTTGDGAGVGKDRVLSLELRM